MKFCHLLPFLLFFGLYRPSAAQEIQIRWDSLYYGRTTEKLNDLILLPDGRLAGAGEIQGQDKSTDGLFVLIDPETGQIERRTFRGFHDQSFNGVAEADDGSFYLVGFTEEERGMGKQGWLVRLDETGEEIFRKTIGGKGDDWFEAICWMDNGAGIIAGFSASQPDGYLWMLAVDGNEYRTKDPAAGGNAKDLKGMQKDAIGRLWLCGNTRKALRIKDPWLIQLDENALSRLELFLGKEGVEEEVHGMYATSEGEVLLVGRTWVAINGESDTWVAEYDNVLQDTEYKTFEFEGPDMGRTIFKSPYGKRWMVLRDAARATSLIGWEADGLEERLLKLDESADFEVVRLLKTYHGSYIMAGHAKDPAGKRKGIRVICFKNGETLASKGFADLEIENPYFVDGNEDGFLSPGERASLHFTIKNTSGRPVREGRIRVEKQAVVDGLTVLHESQFLPYLSANGTRKFYIGLKGEKNLRAGISSFKIILEAEGQPVRNIFFEVESIESENPLAGKKASMVFQRPRLSGDERKVSVSENLQDVWLTVQSSRQLKAEDIKIVVNGTVQEDRKANSSIRGLGVEKGVFVYEFSTLVTLNDSINVVYVSLDDFKTDSIVFEWRSHYPDLHVLAIGPSYQDLQYTAKDARDFARAVAAQQGLGFFDQVFIDTLITPLRTTRSNIEIAFKRLLQRDTAENRFDRIKPNDYLFVFYSGHGIRRKDKFFLVPSDYTPEGGMDVLLDYSELLEKYLNKIKCKKVMFIDACHSGAAKADPADLTMARALMEANQSAPGMMSFASCSENELSYEYPGGENGAFTEALLEALSGGLVFTVGEDAKVLPVTAAQLFSYLRHRVQELAQKKNENAVQTPIFITNELRETLTIFALPKN